MASRRPKSGEITKYEQPLPFHLEEFVTLHLSSEPVPEFAQPLVDEFREYILQRIREHWKDSAKTRMAFANMTPESVWDDFAAKTMILNRRNIATLDPRFSPTLEAHLLDVLKGLIEDLRKQMRAILRAIYAGKAEVDAAETAMAGTDDNDYSIENYGKHLDALAELKKEFKAKYAVIEFARSRELFMFMLLKWEASNKTISQDKSAKGNRNLNNWIPKFRIDTVQVFERSSKQIKQMITAYEETTGKVFKLLDVEYMPYFQKQMSQVAKVKTNFSHFTPDILYFDNPGSTADGTRITDRVLDDCIAPFAAEEDAVPLQPVPAMPVYSEEVGFLFAYY